MKPSGIGGQAVIEGIMMRNKDVYSIAVRKPDNEIEVIKKQNKLLTERFRILNLPIIRGVFNFIDSLVTGTSTLTYSASFYEDPKEQKETSADSLAKAVFKEKLESVIIAVTVLFSVALAVGLFMLAPYFTSRLLSRYIPSGGMLNLIEGLIRVLIFTIYLFLISLMKDIKRVFMYHGAEHKCINCIENGWVLNAENVKKSSRLHKRCGTSFMFFVMFVSVIFFIFIRVPNPFWQVGIRILLVPVIAGISYELIRWAGRSENKFVAILSAPGMLLQKLTTREPDNGMIEVAIRAIEEVFDWKAFLAEYPEDSVKDMDIESTDAEDTVIAAADTEEVQKEYAVTKEAAGISEEIPEYQKHIFRTVQESEDEGDLEWQDAADTDNKQEDPEEDDLDGFEIIEEFHVRRKAYLAKSKRMREANGDDDSDDDGIEFIEEEEDFLEEIPIFKQRKTDL